MEIDPRHPASTTGVQTYLENPIVSAARLDTFIATTVVCLQGDDTDIVRGHRQKLYHEKYEPFQADK